MNNFQFYAGNHISGTAEAESPNSEYMYRIYQVLALGYQITPSGRVHYYCTNDRLPTNAMCSESHSCNGTITGNRMWSIEWHQCQCP